MITAFCQRRIINKGILVKNNALSNVNLISRLGLGFLFIYHGLVPKIIWLSNIEIELVQLSGTGVSAENISPVAGILEILLGLSIILIRKTIYPIYIAALALCCLLVFTAIVLPSLLIEAFNPVSTNILGLVLCYVTIKSQTIDNLGGREVSSK